MLERRKLRGLLFLCALALLFLTVGLFLYTEQQYCLDVPMAKEDALSGYAPAPGDITQLLLNGQPVAADTGENTVYISQAADKLTPSAFQGTLTATDPNCRLFFLKDAALKDIPSAVRSGTPLTLAMVRGDTCHRVKVVITTLPVMQMDGQPTHKDDEGRDVMSGNAVLWAGATAPENAYATTASQVEYHVRGNSTATQPKKSWKLSFKTGSGENNHVSLLGLGEDDDWILNSLTMDDTCLREKLFMDIWNSTVAKEPHNYNMSSGEYVELVLGGKYMGVYLLQRRLDAKYLGLGNADVLLKSDNYQATSAQGAYAFVTPEENKEQVYSLMQGIFTGQDVTSLDLRNMIDTNLLLQLANARDNMSLKNMYHLLKKDETGYTQYLIPWDTDQSFGLVWRTGEGFAYDYSRSLREIYTRWETAPLQQLYPQYGQEAAKRWQALRQTTLTEDALCAHVDVLQASLTQSGALIRNTALWPCRYGGEDTPEALKNFIRQRLPQLDEYYAATAGQE